MTTEELVRLVTENETLAAVAKVAVEQKLRSFAQEAARLLLYQCVVADYQQWEDVKAVAYKHKVCIETVKKVLKQAGIAIGRTREQIKRDAGIRAVSGVHMRARGTSYRAIGAFLGGVSAGRAKDIVEKGIRLLKDPCRSSFLSQESEEVRMLVWGQLTPPGTR